MVASALPTRGRLRHVTLFATLILIAFLAGCNADEIEGPGAGSSSAWDPEASECEPNFAIQLDGIAGHVDLDAEPLGTPASVTVEAWVRLDALEKVHYLVTDASNDFNDGFSLVVTPEGALRFVVAASGSTKGIATGATLMEIDRWYHVAGVYDADAGVVTVYVDGENDGSAGYGGGIGYANGRDLRFGMQVKPLNQNARYLQGAVDEVRIWRIARSAEEIADDADETLEGDAPDLIGYWPLDEGEGSSTADLSGNDNPGALKQGAAWIESSRGGVCDGVVAIDVKPGIDNDRPAPINLNPGRIPVAIYSTPDLDATEQLDRSSLTFGRTGDENSLHWLPRGVPACGPRDVDDDGLVDLLCIFVTSLTGLQPGDTEVFLKGQTLDGVPVSGRDEVRVLPDRGPFGAGR